jgi:hypothetical protein
METDYSKMNKIYVAGAISSKNPIETLHNIGKGLAMGAKVLTRGYAPFVPHADCLLHFLLHNHDLTQVELWYDYSLEWLKVSDAVLVIPSEKKSKGVLQELETARKLNIPIYYDVDDLPTP